MSEDFFQFNFDVIDELEIGDGVKLRLIEGHKTKTKSIQSWHSMGQRWGLMYRYGDIDSIWSQWKKMKAALETEKPKKGKRKK